MAVAATVCTEAMDASETDMTVNDVLGFPASGAYTIRQDSEWMRVTAGAGTVTWTVPRGYTPPPAASHDINTAVYHVPDTYADLSRIKRRLRGTADTATTADDDLLSDLIDAVQSWLVWRLGMFLGPTTSTSIDMDGRAALMGRTRLYVPLGIQSLTSVQVAPETSGTFETVTAGDIISGPRSWEPKADPNQPTTWLQLKDVLDGNWGTWPSGYENVRIAGTLGWSEPPGVIAELADTLVIRMFLARQSGQRDLVGSDELGNPMVSRFVSSVDEGKLKSFRGLLGPAV